MVKPQLLRHFQRVALGLAVNNLVCTASRVAVDKALTVNRKEEGEIRYALFNRGNPRNGRPLTPNNPADIVDNARVHVQEEIGIEGAEILVRVELPNSTFGKNPCFQGELCNSF